MVFRAVAAMVCATGHEAIPVACALGYVACDIWWRVVVGGWVWCGLRPTALLRCPNVRAQSRVEDLRARWHTWLPGRALTLPPRVHEPRHQLRGKNARAQKENI